MTTSDQQRFDLPSIGRPRSPHVHERILQAAAEELAVVGLPAMSLTGVAVRAGVSKTSVLRRWPTVTDLVAELLTTSQAIPEIDDTGDTRAELELLSIVISERMTRNHLDRQLRFTLDSSRYPELFVLYQQTQAQPLVRRSLEVIARAVQRGHAPPETDVPVLTSAFLGALMNSVLSRGGDGVPEPDRKRIAAAFATLLGVPPAGVSGTGRGGTDDEVTDDAGVTDQ